MSYYTESPNGFDPFEYEDAERTDAFAYTGSAPSPGLGWLLGLLGLGLFLLIFARGGPSTQWPESEKDALAQPAGNASLPLRAGAAAEDPYAFRAPYARYVLTQGLHGQSYGHLAIDLAAGKGADVLSPISGIVKDVYTDRWGNPTLVIENDVYEVKMLHGIYAVSPGDVLTIGDVVGQEGNLGYTTDMRGVPCAGRTDYCGYHTHLNVYNKLQQSNVNPLSLIRD